MNQTESELHSRLEERDAEIEGLEAEIKRLKAKRRESSIERLNILSALGQMGQQRDEARATVARVEALCAEATPDDWGLPSLYVSQIRAALATQPTEARP